MINCNFKWSIWLYTSSTSSKYSVNLSTRLLKSNGMKMSSQQIEQAKSEKKNIVNIVEGGQLSYNMETNVSAACKLNLNEKHFNQFIYTYLNMDCMLVCFCRTKKQLDILRLLALISSMTKWHWQQRKISFLF